MMIGASVVFRPDVGRRDPRGLGIGVGLWAVILTTRTAVIVPPLWLTALGVVGLLASLALFNWAAVSIRGRLFSFAGNDDLPQFVHRAGPYAYIRNPFYASYLLAEASTVVIWPNAWGAAIVLVMVGYFQWLARFEEAKFARSAVADDYAKYRTETGRLLPRWRRG